MAGRAWLLAGLLAFCAGGAGAQAVLETRLTWPEQGASPGGLSGLLVHPDGTGFVAVSDRGNLVRADMQRDGAGRLTGISAPEVTPILPPTPEWPDNFYHRDAEALGLLPDGRLAIAFEALHRVTIHLPDGGFNDWIDAAPEFERFGVNTGLEAMAVTDEGLIIAVPEDWPPDPDRRPVFAVPYAPGPDAWTILAWLEAGGGFDPVGLDIDDAGRLYLLERRFQRLLGFSSRLSRFTISEEGAVTGVERLLDSPPGRFGNLEGVSVWRRADGMLIATLIADNNENRLLARDVVEFRLPD